MSDWTGRTFLDLPVRDVALGHGRRKRRHVEVLRSQRRLSGVQSYTKAVSDNSTSDRRKRSPLLALALRSCCDAARADTLHAVAREAIGDRLAGETSWRLGLAGCESEDTRRVEC